MKSASMKISFIVLMAVLTAACGNAQTANVAAPQGSAAPTAAVTAASTAATATQAPTAPVSTIDEKKVTELLAQFNNKTPAKVATVSVSITEILNELGVEPVGVPTSSSKLPEAFAKVARIGSSHQPNLELIAKLTPDVAKEESAALESSKGKTAPKVLFLFGSAESLMLMNENTFAGSFAKKLGASNVVSDVMKLKEAYTPVNMESIVAANPDAILIVAHGDPAAAAKKFEEDVKNNGSWEKLSAFKNGKMKTLDYNLFGIASIMNAPAAYKELSQVLYK